MSRREIGIRDEHDRWYGTLWVSTSKDCGHSVFRINFKDRTGRHTFTALCSTCGLETNVEFSNEVLDTIFGTRRQLFEARKAEREAHERRCRENYDRLRAQAEDCRYASERSTDWHDSRERFKAIQAELKGATLARDQRQELWDVMQQAFTRLGERQDEERRRYDEECERNFARLRSRVEGCLDLARSTSDWREARDHFKEVQAALKERMALRREQRDELWAGVQQAFEVLKERQEAEQRHYSRNHRYVKRFIDEAWEQIGKLSYVTEWSDGELFRYAREAAKRAQQELKDTRPIERETREELFRTINEMFARIKRDQDDWNERRHRRRR